MTKITVKSKSYLYLLIVLIAIAMVMPLLESRHDIFDSLLSVGFFFFFLITAMKALTTRGIAPKSHFVTWLIRVTVGLSFLTGIIHAILQYLSATGEDLSASTEFMSQLPDGLWWLQTMHFISLIGYSTMITILIIFIIKDLFSGERVTIDKIFGAITVYFLLGILWTILFTMVELLQPGSLIRAGGEYLSNYSQVQYFSYTTLCTLGYGDIIPATKLTMVLSNLEAIVGALYLAILVARLVGLYTGQVSRDKLNAALREMEKASSETREELQTIEKKLHKN
ncbi:MAG: potassium channel family protein [Candidatus Auribacterota bacterium]|nr:potassium channel family protein [Candidatus Auribacterota bacterium]